MVCYHSAYHRKRIDIGMSTNDRAGFKTGASHLHIISKHRPEFLKSCFNFFLSVLYNHKCLVRLYVERNQPAPIWDLCPKMESPIVIMRNLNGIKKYHIFQLGRIAHHAVFSYDGISSDKGTMSDLAPSSMIKGPFKNTVSATFADFATQMFSPRFHRFPI